MYMAMATLFNVTYWCEKEQKTKRVQIYASNMGNAFEQVEDKGEVMRITRSSSDNEGHLFR